jgi:hypothetical protein
MFNRVDLRVQLARATTPFVLTSIETTPMYKVLIREVLTTVFTVKVYPVVLLNHVKQHEFTPAAHYFRWSEVKINTTPKFFSTVSKQNLKHHWQNYWMWSYSIYFHLLYKYIIPVELNASNHEQSTAKVHNLTNFIVLPSFHWHVSMRTFVYILS